MVHIYYLTISNSIHYNQAHSNLTISSYAIIQGENFVRNKFLIIRKVEIVDLMFLNAFDDKKLLCSGSSWLLWCLSNHSEPQSKEKISHTVKD